MTPRSRAALVAITAMAAGVRFWALGFGLPYTQARPDETIIIDVALSFLRGNFSPQFFDYPWLYMWSLTLIYLAYFVWGVALGTFHSLADLPASWSTDWAPFFILSRTLSATLGTASVVVVCSIGRRLWDVTTGLVAAFFLSVAFVHVRDSHFGTTDVAMTFLVLVAIALLLDAHLGRRRSVVPAGIAAGLATATKYTAVLLVVPAALSRLLQVLQAPPPRLRALDGRLVGFAFAFGLAFLVGVPFVFLDTHRFLDAMSLLKQSTVRGDGLVPLESGWVHHLRLSLRYGVGLPLLVTGLAGLIAILVRTPKVGVVLFSFPLAYYAVAASVKNLFFRYAIPVVPFLCLAAAWLVCRIAGRLVTDRWTRRWSALAPWLLACAIVAPSAVSVWDFDRILSQTDNRVVVARWFSAHVPRGSSVLQTGSRYGYVQFDREVPYVDWAWDKTRSVFLVGNKPATGRPEWILVQESPLPNETQAVVAEYLKQDYGLVQQFAALSLAEPHVFDQQDAFFVPFAGFKGVRRPGPNFVLYRRIGATAR